MRARRTGLIALGASLLLGQAGTAPARVLPSVPGALARSAQAGGDVEVRDNLFDPDSIEIEVGGTIIWSHAGQASHTVTADDGSFDSHPGCNADTGTGCMQNGDTFQQTFDETGTFAYRCKIHGSEGGGGMAGTVTVREPRTPTPAPPGSEDEGDVTTQSGDELANTGTGTLRRFALGIWLLAAGGAAFATPRARRRS